MFLSAILTVVILLFAVAIFRYAEPSLFKACTRKILFHFPTCKRRILEKEYLLNLNQRLWSTFRVKSLGNLLSEEACQENIILCVNVAAWQAKEACRYQEIQQKGGKVPNPQEVLGERFPEPSWDTAVALTKKGWSSMQKLALEAMPELACRIPHFSQVELKNLRGLSDVEVS